MERTFVDAVDYWAENSDTSIILELLTPFADGAGLDLEPSHQKGCDWSFIEIHGRTIAPDMDVDSGEAIMFLIEWLRSKYSQIDLSFKGGEWVGALWCGDDGEDGATACGPSLATVVLELVTLVWPCELAGNA